MGRLYIREGKYGIDFTDHRGRRVRRLVATDKGVAQKLLGDAITAAEKQRAGILSADPKEGRRPLKTHLDAYTSDLRRRGRDNMYVYTIRKHLEAAAQDRGWECLVDITPKSINDFLKVLSDRKLAAKTVNDYRGDLSAFLGWCVRNALLEANACDQVGKTTVKPVKTRRALSVAECKALLDAAPDDRRVVYRFLVFTGLRRSEAAALRWDHIHLDVMNPHVELPASLTKSGRRESVPLVGEVAEALRQRRGKARDADPVFEAIPTMPEFRADLAAAGIEDEDARGRKVVLHSLRHSLATMLVVSGVPMAIAQRIMRHRDIRLTAEVYTDEGLLPLAAAMRALPSMGVATGLGPSQDVPAAAAS